nr:unnamed protein product [Callosobruchus chinensis]
MEVFQFKDAKIVPDVVHNYDGNIKENCVPVIYDNGSYMARVGWATSNEPLLMFKNLIAKPRKERSKKDNVEPAQAPQLQVGNDIVNIEAVRFQLKTQFDRNIVTHFEAQEHLFDYAFAHLGIDSENRVNHPIVLTEAFLNPNTSRQLMTELLFECYDVPGITYGVDTLFAYHHRIEKPKSDALILSLGYQTCHVVPILDHKVVFENIRRINTGGWNVVTFLHRILQLKYPAHATAITLSRAEELLQTICEVAEDYREELKKWFNTEYYENHIMKIQLPFTSMSAIEQQKERKRELARRLTEINARKREERLAEDQEKLRQLLEVQEVIDFGAEKPEIENLLAEVHMKSLQELQKNITNLNMRIERTRQKIIAANSAEDAEEPPAKQTKLSKMLARKEKGNDDFGLRDEDWDIYKTISKDGGDSDSEAENEKLLEFEEILRNHEPEEFDGSSNPGETHQLHVGIERYRAPELIFKPYMAGSSEAGLSEVIGYVLSLFSADDQLKLANNVIITGGLANLKGLKERILKDLISIRPFQSEVKVSVMKDCSLAPWYGMRQYAMTGEYKKHMVTKKTYEEYGGEYFKTHMASNPYFPSPKEALVDVDT